MRIVIANSRELNVLPPITNLIKILCRNGHKVVVVSEDSNNYRKAFDGMDVEFRVIPSVGKSASIYSMSTYFRNRKRIIAEVTEAMKDSDILWTTTDKTVRELGSEVLKYKHVMQLMELIEDTPAIPKQTVLWCNMKKYAQHAFKVVVPEYNRAHIQKAWWDLKDTPTVLPNKMAEINIGNPPEHVVKVLNELDKEEKKIILYQGLFGNDRDFESFAKAVQDNDEYSLYLMGKLTPSIESLCNKYSNTHHIEYVNSPYHWLFTQKAYIGLLPYKAAKVSYLSILNGIYCAPNKIWDYAAFGVPMIGTEVPGITIPFSIYNMGITCSDQNPEQILEAIKEINLNYKLMSDNCKRFYDSVDLDQIVKGIIS